MRLSLSVAAALSLAASASNIIMSNDDGWAEINLRTFYDTLTAQGHNLALAAPAENQSGKGSSDAPPLPRITACQYDSCPPNSPPTGANASDPRLNYVNSFPVTSMRHGMEVVAPKFFKSPPQLAVAGPNVGSNLALSAFFSGTIGAAVFAASSGVPAIAFSGASGTPTAWNATATPLYSRVYADLAANLTSALLAAGPPYLPPKVWLNVNFPEVSATKCSSAGQFKFVLSRIFPGVPLFSKDVQICGRKFLPWEVTVTGTDGCYVSVSVGDANDKTDGNDVQQAAVLAKLAPILSCLP